MKIRAFIFLNVAILVAFYSVSAFSNDCLNNLYIEELRESSDDFRIVTILKEKEFQFRRTDKGFECARTLLNIYLQHNEYDVADNWLSRMNKFYPVQLSRYSSFDRLNAEMAFVFGNYAEVQRRIEKNSNENLEELRNFARAAEAPFVNVAISCQSKSCVQLRILLNDNTVSKLKSPGLALFYGIVPGMGQVYAGRVLSGFASFVLNTVLIGTTVIGINRGEYAFSTLTGAASLGIYLGSIYAGYESTLRHNEQLEAQQRSNVKNIKFEMKLMQLVF